MTLLDNFYIDEHNTIRLNTFKMVVRDYKTVEKEEYTDTTYYMNDAQVHEWETQLIPKHQLNELVSKEELDTSAYAWMDGIVLRTDNHWKEVEEIASYGSMEAYKASLPEATDEYLIDMDARITAMELGLNE